ncbi:unnamed protein product [Nezara viridula]|uniref:Neuropeptide n=1 Tax=Nezara viridula TaxID=85310 RepID=A0A9P0HAV5_NEZVI|nr:unnamed protein product [Nezara viridula]
MKRWLGVLFGGCGNLLLSYDCGVVSRTPSWTEQTLTERPHPEDTVRPNTSSLRHSRNLQLSSSVADLFNISCRYLPRRAKYSDYSIP